MFVVQRAVHRDPMSHNPLLCVHGCSAQSLAAERMGRAATNVVTCVTGLTIAFQADWRLSLVVLACLPLIALSGHYQMKAFSGQSSAASASLEKVWWYAVVFGMDPQSRMEG